MLTDRTAAARFGGVEHDAGTEPEALSGVGRSNSSNVNNSGGRWFRYIVATVSRASPRQPSSSPPLSSICAKRK